MSGWALGDFSFAVLLLQWVLAIAAVVLVVAGYITLRNRLIRIERALDDIQRAGRTPSDTQIP